MPVTVDAIIFYGFDLVKKEDNEELYEKIMNIWEDIHDKDLPINIINHGHTNFPTLSLVIKSALIVANFQTIVKLIETILDTNKFNELLKEFCDKYKLEYKEPSWWLTSFTDF